MKWKALIIRFTASQHKALRKASAEEGRSMTAIVRSAVTDYIAETHPEIYATTMTKLSH